MTRPRNIAVLGSTGSVGTSALEVSAASMISAVDVDRKPFVENCLRASDTIFSLSVITIKIRLPFMKISRETGRTLFLIMTIALIGISFNVNASGGGPPSDKATFVSFTDTDPNLLRSLVER